MGKDHSTPHRPIPSSLFGLLALCLLLPCRLTADETSFNLQAVDGYILPGYQAMADETATLHRESQRYCAAPSAEHLQALRERYQLAMDSWQRMQTIRFGPIEQAMRSNRLEFWPDKRHSVERHLSALLDKADEEQLQPDHFAAASVAVQGFSALERLLFDEAAPMQTQASGQGGDFRCRTLMAITGNIAGIAASTLAEWREGEHAHRALIASAAFGNAAYGDSSEVSARLLNNLYTELELVIEQKLEAPLGADIGQARGRRSESWRSERSLRDIRYNLDGIEQLAETAFISRLHEASQRKAIEDAMATARSALAAIDKPLHKAVTDPINRPRVEALVAALDRLKQLIVGDLATTLEIPIGFNSLDGD